MSTEANEFKTISKGNLSLDIYNATEDSFGVASVIIFGHTDALLVDAQFTLAHAERVAARIKDSGKKLTLTFISAWKYLKNIFQVLLHTQRRLPLST